MLMPRTWLFCFSVSICYILGAFSVLLESPLKPVKGKLQVGKLQLSPLGVGTWSWGNQFLWGYSTKDDATLRETYNYLLSNGINWFDTADSYGTGSLTARSEVLLGQFASEAQSSKKKATTVHYCTKIAPFPWVIGENAITNKVKRSQDRLNRTIDILQLHWPPTLGWQEEAYYSAFTKSVKNNIATQIGLSNYGPRKLQATIQRLKLLDQTVSSNQVQFSLLSSQPLRSGLTEVCSTNNICLIGYSPLALGLLTDKYSLDRLPKGPRSLLFKEFLPVIQPLLAQLRIIAKERGKSVSQVAINWSLQKGVLPLVGIRSVAQAKENIGALTFSLSKAEVEELDTVVVKLPKSMVQNFNQSP